MYQSHKASIIVGHKFNPNLKVEYKKYISSMNSPGSPQMTLKTPKQVIAQAPSTGTLFFDSSSGSVGPHSYSSTRGALRSA